MPTVRIMVRRNPGSRVEQAQPKKVTRLPREGRRLLVVHADGRAEFGTVWKVESHLRGPAKSAGFDATAYVNIGTRE
jgi:hypothetical protein